MSSWVPNPERIDRYINVLTEYYQDYDIFVGINPSTHDKEWVKALEATGLSLKWKITEPHIVIPQHASAVQTALQLYKESNVDYDVVHFIHTKGISYSDEVKSGRAFNDYYVTYSSRLKEAEEYLTNNPLYGGWAHYGMVQPQWFRAKEYDVNAPKGNEWMAQTYEKGTNTLHDYWDWGEFYKFEYTPLRTQWLTGFYTIKHDLLRNFIDNCTEDFLNKSVVDMGYDIYFFETQIAQVVCRQGYLRYIDELWVNPNLVVTKGSKVDEDRMMGIWSTENNIDITKKEHA